MISRRTVLAAMPQFVAWSAVAQDSFSALQAYEQQTGGRVGVYALNTATGAELKWRADERFVMCSTVKASIAACVLARVDRGRDDLARMISFSEKDLEDYAPAARKRLGEGRMSVADMCAGAVEMSDSTCANMLLASVGGPGGLTEFWRSIGDAASRLDHKEPELNRSPPGNPEDTTTPAAMATNLRRLVLGDALTPVSREHLIGWMKRCQTGAKRLRAGLPSAWLVGDKTGANLKDAAGDIAVAWTSERRPVVIAAYTQGGTPSPAQIDAVFKFIGQSIGDQVT